MLVRKGVVKSEEKSNAIRILMVPVTTLSTFNPLVPHINLEKLHLWLGIWDCTIANLMSMYVWYVCMVCMYGTYIPIGTYKLPPLDSGGYVISNHRFNFYRNMR